MKIIFLDIDGVINSDTYLKSRPDNSDYNRIDMSRIKLLADLVKSTDAKIVLTSTWRVDWNMSPLFCGDFGKYINECFAVYGLYVLDKTPVISLLSHRRKEILTWLSSHLGEVESFVILDDISYGWEELGGRVVITNPKGNGLEEEHVQKAREILNVQIAPK